jgi:hypothetical protein
MRVWHPIVSAPRHPRNHQSAIRLDLAGTCGDCCARFHQPPNSGRTLSGCADTAILSRLGADLVRADTPAVAQAASAAHPARPSLLKIGAEHREGSHDSKHRRRRRAATR